MDAAATDNQTNTMQNYCKTIGALAAASALVAGTASAEITGDVHVGYASEYLFRGLILGNDLVETGVDVATEWNGLAVSAGAWFGSFDAVDADRELDLFGEVSKDLGFANAAVGYIWYHNFGSPRGDAQEVYFSLGRDLGFATASLTYFWDVETDNDGYTELALGKSWEINQCLALNLDGTLGYLAEHGQLSHAGAKLSLDYNFAGTATLSPFAAHSWSLNNNARTTHGNSSNEFIGGAVLSVGF
jgi:hypothetical protein